MYFLGIVTGAGVVVSAQFLMVLWLFLTDRLEGRW